MKTPEDEAFDELAQRQGHWGGGFMAKKAMAMDKLQEPAQDYIAKNPLGGPAKVFDAIADCIRAGDSIESVMATYGLVWAQDVPETSFGDMAQPEHLRDFFYTCNHCGEETLVQSGNHHPWCACGSDDFDWGNERPAHPAKKAMAADKLQEPVTGREALKLALEFVESVHAGEWGSATNRDELVAAIKAALAQPAQEPVTWFGVDFDINTTPPQRERVVFPTMLRKMWSGGEVQAWLDENVNKEKNDGT